LKIDLGKILLCASLDSRNKARRFSTQQMPGFFVRVVLRSWHGGTKANCRHSPNDFFGEDVPHVFRDYICRDEVERIFLVDMVAGSDGAWVATVLLADRRLHLDAENSRALMVYQGVISGGLSPRPCRAQSLFDGAQCEAHLGPCSSIFGVLNVHPARFFHALALFSCALPSICRSSEFPIVPIKTRPVVAALFLEHNPLLHGLWGR
jgi:hypothetical protein